VECPDFCRSAQPKGNDLLHFFPEIAADLRKLPDCAIDAALLLACLTHRT
jgi:hypothetical protein